jgi:hypothetical protein
MPEKGIMITLYEVDGKIFWKGRSTKWEVTFITDNVSDDIFGVTPSPDTLFPVLIFPVGTTVRDSVNGKMYKVGEDEEDIAPYPKALPEKLEN